MLELVILGITNIVTLVAAGALVVSARRDVRAERAYGHAVETNLLEQKRLREDQLLNRIQAPAQAIAQATVENAERYAKDYPQPYIGAFDDEGAAEYERERARIETETRKLVEQYDAPAEAAA